LRGGISSFDSSYFASPNWSTSALDRLSSLIFDFSFLDTGNVLSHMVSFIPLQSSISLSDFTALNQWRFYSNDLFFGWSNRNESHDKRCHQVKDEREREREMKVGQGSLVVFQRNSLKGDLYFHETIVPSPYLTAFLSSSLSASPSSSTSSSFGLKHLLSNVLFGNEKDNTSNSNMERREGSGRGASLSRIQEFEVVSSAFIPTSSSSSSATRSLSLILSLNRNGKLLFYDFKSKCYVFSFSLFSSSSSSLSLKENDYLEGTSLPAFFFFPSFLPSFLLSSLPPFRTSFF
jgi:hypothetical protein